jgi:hypothetical protein
MTVGGALRIALRDFYHQSWRLFVLNTSLSLFVAGVVTLGLFLPPPAFLLVLAVGPLLAALMHCTVTLAQTEDLRLADARVGLLLHWRRGLALFTLVAAAAVLIATAVPFYSELGGVGRVLAAVAVYLAAFFGIYQVALWPLAVYEHERTLRSVFRDALLTVFRRPFGFFALATALLLVNVAGAAAALAPLLTITIAYSFLAAAHYTLPPNPTREA